MEIMRIAFFEHPPYLDQVVKSHRTSIKKDTVDRILDRAQLNGTGMGSINRVASEFLSPTGRAFSAKIDGGWGVNRIAFCMVVNTSGSRWSKEYNYLTGYTDHAEYHTDRSGGTVFSDNMRLYFNGITGVEINASEFRNTEVWEPRLNQHDQILNSSVFGRESKDRALLRPADLFRRQGERDTFGEARGSGGAFSTRTRVLTGAFTTRLTANNRLNNNGTSFLSRTLGAYNKSALQNRDLQDDDNTAGDILSEATDRLGENIVNSNSVFDVLRRHTNILADGFVTYGDFKDAFPDFNEDTQSSFQRLPRNHTDMSHHSLDLRGDTEECIAINVIKQSLPGILYFSSYSSVQELVINSHPRPGENAVVVGMITPYMQDGDIRSTYDYFITQIEDQILPDITRNGRYHVRARINLDVEGDLEIWLEVDGNREVYSNTPTFTDGLTAATLTDDLDNVANVSSDILQLADRTYNALHRQHPTHFNKEPEMARSPTGERVDTKRKNNW